VTPGADDPEGQSLRDMLHPFSRDFRWAPPAGPFRRVSDAQARAFDEQGYFLLEDALDPETVSRVVAEIDPFEERVEAFLRGRPDGKAFIARAGEITFTTHLVLRSAALRAFCASPLFQDLGHDLIGPDVRLYWDQAVYKKPEADRDFPWHQDNGYTFVEPQQYLTCWIALTDATLENGCPEVAPGLHRRGTLRHWMTDTGWRCLDEAPDAVPVPVRAGSAVVFSSLTPHRTGPNRSGSVRKAYIVQLAPEGARIVQAGADGAPAPGPAADDPQRQYRILAGGAPVAPPPLAGSAAA
jgi:ectoine hydroxylase-related dioxygenase (phytanoyl-CoA dioxygenase family)